MTPALRTAILDALMERWWEGAIIDVAKNEIAAMMTPEQFLAWSALQEPSYRECFNSCLDMILPVAEPMIREDERPVIDKEKVLMLAAKIIDSTLGGLIDDD